MSDTYRARPEAGGVTTIRGGTGRLETEEEKARKKREKFNAEHDQKMGATGIGGARKKTPQYLKDRDDAYTKATAGGWGNQ